ncbi:MAG TPA: Gfo/Idh/MocA family oxidoreductase [Terriglobales bacterium]|nr:Gfo/Idh/MocA family oxidoreductase [Terriglobales bacterium]
MIRFGILGFGLHAVKRLIPGFRAAKRCRVTALSRRDPEKARASATQFDIPYAFSSAEELCRCPEVDAVFVTTPNACHRDDVLLALRCGKPVLCEKPMAIDADQCREMVEGAHRARLLLGVAQVFRFHETLAWMRARIAASEIGKPVFARSEFFYPGRSHPRTWLTDKSIAGGGPVADVGVHCIDALRFVLLDEAVRVHTRGVSDAESGDVESAAILSLLFRKGTLATVMVSTRTQYRTPMEFIGEEGEIFADDALSVEHPVRVELSSNDQVIACEELSNHFSYTRQVDAFAASLEERIPFPATGEDGWQNQLVLDAAYRSMQSGQMETIQVL